jgi:hypothetical protein
MAFSAIISKLTIVDIVVTVCTFLKWDINEPLKIFAIPYLCLVTFGTIYVSVLAHQGKICRIMIKIGGRRKNICGMAACTVS